MVWKYQEGFKKVPQLMVSTRKDWNEYGSPTEGMSNAVIDKEQSTVSFYYYGYLKKSLDMILGVFTICLWKLISLKWF